MSSELFLKLRQEYPLFKYCGFEILSSQAELGTNLHFRFTFTIYNSLGEETFRFMPEWKIQDRYFYRKDSVSKAMLNRLIFNIGMIELVSYWKCTASPRVEIEYSQEILPEEALSFWKDIYFDGLGEYFYLNGIDAGREDFMEIKFCKQETKQDKKELIPLSIVLSENVIVPIGGGKDSVVSWNILKEKKDLLPLILNPRGASLDCCKVDDLAIKDIAVMERTIDPLLLELNKKGFLNGHTPFSALLAFSSLLICALSGRKYLALSNENSANESTVKNSMVNHQYSKSLRFEEDFSEYVAKYISPDFYYFSFLRPLSELAIAKVFSKLYKYHDVFKSCNVGSKHDIWCASCSKCLFAYIILSPFVSQQRLEEIFGKNMLKEEKLIPILKELCGITDVKPFECVGTLDEVNWAMQQLYDIWEKNKKEYPLLSVYFLQYKQRKISNSTLTDFNIPHRLPLEFEDILRSYLEQNRILEWN